MTNPEKELDVNGDVLSLQVSKAYNRPDVKVTVFSVCVDQGALV